MRIETQIEPDETVDDRLVGVWQIVHQAPEEIEDQDALRFDEDLGIYGSLVIGEADGSLIAVGIDQFRSDGAIIIGDFIVKTRKHKTKQFIVGEFISREEDRGNNEQKSTQIQIVLEYAFNEGGDLFLWGLHDGLFDDKDDEFPPLAHRVDRNSFGAELTTITASPHHRKKFSTFSSTRESRLIFSIAANTGNSFYPKGIHRPSKTEYGRIHPVDRFIPGTGPRIPPRDKELLRDRPRKLTRKLTETGDTETRDRPRGN